MAIDPGTQTVLVQILGVVVGNAALIIPLWLWSSAENRADMRQMQEVQAADRKDILSIIRSIQEEIKDFHGRLERQDAEFKSHLQYHGSLGEKS